MDEHSTRPLNEPETSSIEAAINAIAAEYDRVYWNQHQKEPIGNFTDNVGCEVICDAFKARSYVWDENSARALLPNFQYKSLQVDWYKHLGRCTHAIVGKDIDLDAEFIGNMILECSKAIQRMDLPA